MGSYRRSFLVPQAWSGQRIYLHFSGTKSALKVWVNGKSVGYSQGSMCAAEFDVTDFVIPGENQLACEVYRWSDDSYLEEQDMWRMSSIDRDVFLCCKPQVHLWDQYVEVGLSKDNTQGQIRLHASLRKKNCQAIKDLLLTLRHIDDDQNLVCKL